MTYKTYKNQFGHVQTLQNSIWTCAEFTKINSDMCRTYKIRFGHVQNLQKSIRTCAELTKFDSDMCRTYKIRFGHVQNLQKSIRTCAELTKSVKILLKIRTNASAPQRGSGRYTEVVTVIDRFSACKGPKVAIKARQYPK